MYQGFLLILWLLLPTLLTAQSWPQGRVVVDSLYSERLENDYGENPTRAVSVYLPPGYAEGSGRYPVIYYLHGFLNDHTLTAEMVDALDYAIAHRRVRPFILVVADNRTRIDGSFYSNSELFGDWEDFVAIDLVRYADENYRTLPRRASRGITGHSMGGYGALKLAMRHPETFSSVYALSPGGLTVVGEYGPNSYTFQELAGIKDMETLMDAYFPKVIVAFGRAWSPNPDKPPFYVDLPFEYVGDSLVVHPEILDKWYDEMPLHLIEDHLPALRSLSGIALDWGRNAGDRFVRQCEMFSQRLENVGIAHQAEEYIGTHTSGIFTRDGRVPTDMLPFFDARLEFGE
ncbi:pimeloyl-ACP methyl ester carboxylesterase [Lewinella marina]|uniref:Esterase n=1 Tax=Neolewinella marina TaxID=438751 RepID=A0A2G0CB50_9BACT|nr:alpha/beta hydrolase-fold protein [Neolewinella marina]NJB84269.1 pimeloyl-ACP methyl ester carboxylesterase [Neolewinella marina]PHK97147.1 esterase [Neolewinella marina]